VEGQRPKDVHCFSPARYREIEEVSSGD
jgi:hypothetical protein